MVTNEKSGRNIAKVDLPGKSMRSDVGTLAVVFNSDGCPSVRYSPACGASDWSCPIPASFRLGRVLRKVFFWRHKPKFIEALPRTEFSFAAVNCGRTLVEFITALLTWNRWRNQAGAIRALLRAEFGTASFNFARCSRKFLSTVGTGLLNRFASSSGLRRASTAAKPDVVVWSRPKHYSAHLTILHDCVILGLAHGASFSGIRMGRLRASDAGRPAQYTTAG